MRSLGRRASLSTPWILDEHGPEVFVAHLGRRLEELKRRKRVLLANRVLANDTHRVVMVGCDGQSVVAFSVWRSMLLSSLDWATCLPALEQAMASVAAFPPRGWV